MTADTDREMEHKWFKPDFMQYEACATCGIVRYADDKNKPCKGPTSLHTLSVPDDEIAGIRERRAKITPGEWRATKDGYIRNSNPVDSVIIAHVGGGWWDDPEMGHSLPRWQADATFIAHAPTDIDTLLSAITALQSREEDVRREERERCAKFVIEIASDAQQTRERYFG
jgi:hypothetical protein